MLVQALQAKLGGALIKSMANMRTQKGELSIEDMGAIFMDISRELNPNNSAADQAVHNEINKLVKYIAEAKHEIFSISTDEKSSATINDASQHLDEVIKETEKASNAIMDATEVIQTNINGVGGEKEQKIMEAANQIFEACNFQDITGQRIRKVISLISSIEDRIEKLHDLFGAPAPAAKKEGEKNLLNGPQLAGQGASQAEVDALLASFGDKK